MIKYKIVPCGMFVATLCLLTLSEASFAQTTPAPSQPAAPAPVAPTPPTTTQPLPVAPATPPVAPTPPAPATTTGPATSYEHHYLDYKVQLTERNKIFYVPRKKLGISLADGISDKTVAPEVKFNVDQTVLSAFLTRLQSHVDRNARPARVALVVPIEHETAMKSDNVPRPATALSGTPAVKLLVPESMSAIANTITATPLATTIPLAIKVGPIPAGTDKLDGIDARLAHFVTHFDTAEVGRTMTVRRAIQLIDGSVLQPGQIFSINDSVGERTVARGFGIGKVFINGTMENQVGGGMCQVATTLFNAALLANLEIVERHQHVRTVPYVPAGGDATVYYGEKDFRFANNTSAPVYIYYKTYGRFAVCDLYGKANPDVKVRVETIPTRLGERYYKGVIKRYVTVDGKTTVNYIAYSSYKWTPSLDYMR